MTIVTSCPIHSSHHAEHKWFLAGFALPSSARSKVGCKPEILTEAYSDFRLTTGVPRELL